MPCTTDEVGTWLTKAPTHIRVYVRGVQTALLPGHRARLAHPKGGFRRAGPCFVGTVCPLVVPNQPNGAGRTRGSQQTRAREAILPAPITPPGVNSTQQVSFTFFATLVVVVALVVVACLLFACQVRKATPLTPLLTLAAGSAAYFSPVTMNPTLNQTRAATPGGTDATDRLPVQPTDPVPN